MLTAKKIFESKIQTVPVNKLKVGDFIHYIGKYDDRINAFIDDIQYNNESMEYKIRVSSGQFESGGKTRRFLTVDWGLHALCVQCQ